LRAQLLKYWNHVHSSFWFLPLSMTFAAVALAFLMLAIDQSVDTETLSAWWTFQSEADAATALMETIASSTITTASVVFSIMLVALSLASSQFGSRLISNYMRDSRTQFALGTFVATYIYCLLVIRAIRSSDAIDGAFIPELSVAVGVILAILNIFVLIYFIHHIAVSIQASEILARIGSELNERIDHLFPEQPSSKSACAQTRSIFQGLPDDFEDQAAPVEATSDGYLQTVDLIALIELASKKNMVVKLECSPGEYIIQGMPLVKVAPGTQLDEKLTSQINFMFVTDVQRTPGQDILFVVNQLVEVAVRALSPSLNDPFTAITAIDHLGSALCRLVKCDTPSPYLFDDQGRLRVYAPAITFTLILDDAFSPIRQFSQSNVPVVLRAFETLRIIAQSAVRAEDCAALRRHADMLIRGARSAISEAEDLLTLEQAYGRINEQLERHVLLEN
jgi:uncharacterized membrane protein